MSVGESEATAGDCLRRHDETEDGKQFLVRDKNGAVAPFRLFL
jgi:hypothetical protein